MLNIIRKYSPNRFLQRYAATKAAIQTKIIPKQKESRPAIIQCKRPNYNLYQYQEANCKFGTLPLASSGWLHQKSKGDWFNIPVTRSEDEKSQDMKDLQEFITEKGLIFDKSFLLNLSNEMEVKKLTNIQCEGWPTILGYNHTLIAAETDAARLCATSCPCCKKYWSENVPWHLNVKMNSPLAVIITPGRELASQIEGVVRKVSWEMDIRVKAIFGGNTKQMMMNPKFDDVDVVVSSMGALCKLVTTGIYRMDHVRHVVLDEADTLLDDSFSEKLVHLMKRFPFHRNLSQSDTVVGTQLILASATMPQNIEELLKKVIDVSTIKEVTSPDLHRLMPHVEQKFIRTNKADRPANLLNIVRKELSLRRPVIVFSNKTPTCDYVSIFLNNNGINCINLNGDMLMKIRLGRFQQFQSAACDVLSTTDVASRGLDTTRARHVVNFDFPLHVSDYIHRAGRIGRVGNMERCSVTNLISSRREIDIVQRIEHAARCGGLLPDVNANIKNIINKKIMQDMKAAGVALPTNENQQTEEEF